MRVGLISSTPAFPKSHFGSVEISHQRPSLKRNMHGMCRMNRNMHPLCLANADADSTRLSTRLHQRRRILEVAFAIFVSVNIPIASASSVIHPSSKREVQFIFPQAERLVAVGDLHGDLTATREALRIAGVLHPARDEWVGGQTVVVQVGDQLDRGDNEIDVLSLLHRLKTQANATGGAVHILAGNHETMNARGNFRYATAGAMRQFKQWESVCQYKRFLPGFVRDAYHCGLFTRRLECGGEDQACKNSLAEMNPLARSRFLALNSGGVLSKDLLAQERLAVVIVGDTLFVHGGLTKELISSSSNVTKVLQKLNADLSAFFAGEQKGKKAYKGEKVLWNRDYSGRSVADLSADPRACAELAETLERMPGSVRRMVVGHSVQKGGSVTSACGGAVWRVDIGMSRGVLGSSPQVLEIRPGDRVTVLSSADYPGAGQLHNGGWVRVARGWVETAASSVYEAWDGVCRSYNRPKPS